MANPQADKHFTRISNEIMEALARIRIPGEARQILDFILRKTYGFQKKEDAISLSQFVLGTGQNKPNVCRSIQKLLSMNIIIKKDNKVASIYGLEKDFDTWKALSKPITTVIKNDNESKANQDPEPKTETGESKNQNEALSKPITTVIKNDNNRYQKRDIQKKVTKETITKESDTQKKQSSKMTDEEFIQALKNNPAYGHIDIDRETGKMSAWLLTHPGRKLSRQFAVNWLNRIEPPMNVQEDDGYYLTNEQIAETIAYEDKLYNEILGPAEYNRLYPTTKKAPQ